jgi:hypothetical protein
MFCTHRLALHSTQMPLTMNGMDLSRGPYLFRTSQVSLERKLTGGINMNNQMQNVQNHISPFTLHQYTPDIIKQDTKCTYAYNIEACSRSHCRHGISTSITYSECVSVPLVIQNANRMCWIILPSVACMALPHSSTLSHEWHNFQGEKKDYLT